MAEQLYNRDKIERAVSVFEGEGLDAPEALLASARLFIESLEKFKKEAPGFRTKVGEEAIRQFAMEDMNDLIYEIQDAVPVALRIYNSMMRDPDDSKGGAKE